MKKITAVVVTYNRCSLLKRCLEALLRQTYPCEILIIDNASEDATGEMLEKFEEPAIRVLRLGKKSRRCRWFLYRHEKSCRRWQRIYWLMDDDTFPEPDALEQLMKADEKLNGEYGFLSPPFSGRTEALAR